MSNGGEEGEFAPENGKEHISRGRREFLSLMDASFSAPFEVRCPLHGSIPFDARERAIIDHRFVQRLRYISQLGFASLVFPGATHTRFSHSLGVMHLAGQVFDQIALKSAAFRDCGFSSATHARFRRIVRLAGLLHDLGHPPFSHSFEPLLPIRERLPLPWEWYRNGEKSGRATHEDYSVAAIHALAEEKPDLMSLEDARAICSLIDTRISPGATLLDGQGGGISVYPLLKQIVSGEIDADRMDYLRRDAHFAGVSYGLFDLPRLIQSLSCTVMDGGLVMTLAHNALYTYENFLMARFHMAMQVYFHKTLLPFEYFLKRAVEDGEIELALDGSLESFLSASEDHVMHLLHQAKGGRWAARIVNRLPLSRLLRMSDLPDKKTRARVMKAVARLEDEGCEIIHLKEERRLSNLGWSETGKNEAPIYVEHQVLGRPDWLPLEDVSVLLERYNQVFTIEALYCDPAEAGRGLAALREAL